MASTDVVHDGASSPYCSKLRKRNRGLPVFSDCQGCGVRSVIQGKDRLLILRSVYRVILLCSKCFHRVKVSEICSYCFGDISAREGSTVQCHECERLIHFTCTLDYCGFAPMQKSDSFTCVDCWMPKSCKEPYMVSKSKDINSCNSENFKVFKAIDCSRFEEIAGKKLPHASRTNEESVARTSDKMSRKKVIDVIKLENVTGAKENMRKADTDQRNCELMERVLDQKNLTVRERDEGNNHRPAITFVSQNDEALALSLHLSINSSPRMCNAISSMKSTHDFNPRKKQCMSNSVESNCNSLISFGSYGILVENPILRNSDESDTEESISKHSIDVSEHKCSEELEINIPISSGNCGKSSQFVGMKEREVGFYEDLVGDEILENNPKEEHALHSNVCSVDHNVLTRIRPKTSDCYISPLPTCECNSSQLQNIKCDYDRQTLITYKRKHLRKKTILVQRIETLSEDFSLKSQASSLLLSC